MAKMRMVWWCEVKWLLASYFIRWACALTADEATTEMLQAQLAFVTAFKNKREFDVVQMRRKA